MSVSENPIENGGCCEQCGAVGVGDSAGCLNLYENVLAREYSDQRYFKCHRLTVDAYCLQHPERYMISGKSYAVHLIRMHAALEMNNDPGLNRILLKWVGTNPTIEKPAALPEKRGELTILYIYDATTADEHNDRVLQWARNVWSSWSQHHSTVRHLIEIAERDS